MRYFLCILLSSLSLASFAQTSKVDPTVAGQSNVSTRQELTKEAVREAPEWEKSTALGTIALGVFTLGLAIAAFWQRFDLKTSSERQLRAYVLVTDAAIDNVADPLPSMKVPEHNPAAVQFPNIGPRARVWLRNTGQTPALEVVCWMNMVVREYPLNPALGMLPIPSEDQVSEVFLSKNTLGRDMPFPKHFSLPARLTATTIDALRNNTEVAPQNRTVG